jgi:hypothetical protein
MSQQSRCGAVGDANWLLFQNRRTTARCATSEARGVSVYRYPTDYANGQSRRDMAVPADQVFVVILAEVAARSQGRPIHLVNGCRGDGRCGDAEFGGDRGDRALGDVEVNPTAGGEIRADVALVVLLRFLAGQPA